MELFLSYTFLSLILRRTDVLYYTVLQMIEAEWELRMRENCMKLSFETIHISRDFLKLNPNALSQNSMGRHIEKKWRFRFA